MDNNRTNLFINPNVEKNSKTKYLLYSVIILIISMTGCGDSGESKEKMGNNDTVQVSEEEQSTEIDPVDKDAVKEYDKKIYKMVSASTRVSDILVDSMGEVGDGKMSRSELKELATQAKDAQSSLQGSLLTYDDVAKSMYLESAHFYLTMQWKVASDLLKFCETDNKEDLDNCGDVLRDSPDYLKTVDSARVKYLSEQGFSEEEIVAITTAVDEEQVE
ncbi:hypothetical protein FRZ06_13135 [Anoxybacterium hadale]|uniref:Uncharacterized protein n=1 Tax=Anoxybacterium hadale TaxID=3408580 RepID=A0ACD1ADK5_9FIRM|nr:hypothetical protein FRZ06_13135 [Clostridiales bacterium]